MHLIGEALFAQREPDLAQFLKLQSLARARRALSASGAEDDPARLREPEVRSYFSAAARFDPLHVDWSRMTARVEEIVAPIGEGGARVRALLASRAAPFTGDARLWRLRPEHAYDMPPRASIAGQHVVVSVVAPLSKAVLAKAALEDAITALMQCLRWQQNQVEAHNERVSEILAPLIGEFDEADVELSDSLVLSD